MISSPASTGEPGSDTDFSRQNERGIRIRWIRRMAGIATALVLVAAFWMYHRREQNKAKTSPETSSSIATVRVATAHRGDIGVYIHALGNVTPVSTVNIYSQLSGRVVAVHYREGQMVSKGSPLIDIDPLPYQAQVQQAEGTLERDRSLLTQAEMDLARYREAYAGHGVSRQTLEDQEQVVRQYQGTVKYDQGQLQYARVQLNYCHIVSPISGRMGLRLVDPGNTVFSGSSNTLAVVTQLQPITVVFDVAEDHLPKVRSEILRRNRFAVDAFDRSLQTKLASGKLLTFDNLIDTATGTVRFRAEFPNEDLALFPNQFVNARVLVDTLKGATLIPSGAIQHNGVQAFVYVVHQKEVKSINVAARATDGSISAVEGISPGDIVAISGFEKLQDGTKIAIVPENAQQTSGAER